MDDYVAVIGHQPTVLCCAFEARFQLEFRQDLIPNCIRQRLKHTLAGPRADDKIIGDYG